MHPELNVARGARDGSGRKQYEILTQDLNDRIDAVSEGFRQYRRAVKDTLII